VLSTNDYRHSASSYALRGITGTDLLAFRTVEDRILSLKLAGRALDLGCGAGRSTRFLKSLGLEAVGVDIDKAMVAEARRRDPEGSYLAYDSSACLPCEVGAFEVLLASWVIIEIGDREQMSGFLTEAGRVLSSGGIGFVVANRAEFYSGRWVSCEVDFPENEPPLQSGQRVRARLTPEDVVVTDTYWSDEDYRQIFAQSGLAIEHAWTPIAQSHEPDWLDEVETAPFVIYEFRKA
jgi:SAM-dependent methyltransferase